MPNRRTLENESKELPPNCLWPVKKKPQQNYVYLKIPHMNTHLCSATKKLDGVNKNAKLFAQCKKAAKLLQEIIYQLILSNVLKIIFCMLKCNLETDGAI